MRRPPPRRRPIVRVLRAVCGVVLILSVLASAHIAHAALTTTGHDRVSAQLNYLDRAVHGREPTDMQGLFPEGEFFTHALTGLAAGREALAGRDVQRNTRLLADAIDAVSRPSVSGRFGSGQPLDHGVFYRGWRLLLLVEQAQLTQDAAQRQAVLDEAQQIATAMSTSSTWLLSSYPGLYWPCDNIVAAAAVQWARELGPVPGTDFFATTFLERTRPARDAATGLYAHQVDADGHPLGGPRGSSQAIIQTFLPDLDRTVATDQWQRFTTTFVTREAGLVGVREYPRGTSGSGDNDSGPLIFGVSPSASAVTLGAARRNGDTALAGTLDREAELLGLPMPWQGASGTLSGRTFAAGLLPVGDAFVVASRTTPVGTPTASREAGALWWVWFGCAAVPGLIALIVLWPRFRPVHRDPPSSAPADDSPADQVRTPEAAADAPDPAP